MTRKRPTLAWENSNSVPSSRKKGYRTSWNFMPCEEREKTVKMFPIMRTGALNMYGMQDYLRNKKNEERKALVAKWKHTKKQKDAQLGNKNSQFDK